MSEDFWSKVVNTELKKALEEIRQRQSNGESEIDIMFDVQWLKKSKNGREALKILEKSCTQQMKGKP